MPKGKRASELIGDIFNKKSPFTPPKRTKMKGAVEPARPIKKSKMPKPSK